MGPVQKFEAPNHVKARRDSFKPTAGSPPIFATIPARRRLNLALGTISVRDFLSIPSE
jgi:hypothetical protein